MQLLSKTLRYKMKVIIEAIRLIADKGMQNVVEISTIGVSCPVQSISASGIALPMRVRETDAGSHTAIVAALKA